MECSYTICPEGNITYIYVEGTVSAAIITQIIKELWQGKDYEHPCVLWDFGSCVAGLGPEELKELGRLSREEKAKRGYGKVALVVSSYFHFELSRIYETYVDELPYEVKAFKDIATAKKWLQKKSTKRVLPVNPLD
jgi:hypothetical protein